MTRANLLTHSFRGVALTHRAHCLALMIAGELTDDDYSYWKGDIAERRDGEWFRVGSMYQIGRKTIQSLVDRGLIEPRFGVMKFDWHAEYRMVPDRDDVDLGDLWIE